MANSRLPAWKRAVVDVPLLIRAHREDFIRYMGIWGKLSGGSFAGCAPYEVSTPSTTQLCTTRDKPWARSSRGFTCGQAS